MSLSQYELAQIVEALDTIRKRLDALEAAQTDAFHVAQPAEPIANVSGSVEALQ